MPSCCVQLCGSGWRQSVAVQNSTIQHHIAELTPTLTDWPSRNFTVMTSCYLQRIFSYRSQWFTLVTLSVCGWAACCEMTGWFSTHKVVWFRKAGSRCRSGRARSHRRTSGTAGLRSTTTHHTTVWTTEPHTATPTTGRVPAQSHTHTHTHHWPMSTTDSLRLLLDACND